MPYRIDFAEPPAEEAFRLGRLVYAESPERYVRRMRHHLEPA